MILGQQPRKPPVLLPLDGRQPQNISEWLEVATWNLVPSAQTRIRAEIEVHYAEAAQSHQANGASEIAANVAALADLGNAQAAARRFSQQYLTVEEAKLVGRRIKAARSTGLLSQLPLVILLSSIVVSCLLLLRWALAPAARGHFPLCAVVLLLLALIFASTNKAARKLARRKSTLATVRQVVLLERVKGLSLNLLNMVNMVAVMMNISATQFTDHTFVNSASPFAYLDALEAYADVAIKIGCGMMVFGILLVAVATNGAETRLRKKLASASEDDLPPPDSASA